MNLTASLGAGAVAATDHRLDGATPSTKRAKPLPGDLTQTELTLRFAFWAMELRRFPTVAQIQDRFEISRASAHRWRAALASAQGIVPPQDVALEDVG